MRVLLAHPDSPWCRMLAEMLRVEFKSLDQTNSGKKLLESVSRGASPPPYELIVAGGELAEIGALDAFYQASLGSERIGDNPRPPSGLHRLGPKKVLVTTVRIDHELLALFRRRGIVGFIYRDDPHEKTLAALTSIAFPEMRSEPRYSCDFEAGVQHQGLTFAAHIKDMSRMGCLLVTPDDSRKVPPAVGAPIQIQPKGTSTMLSAEVRNVRSHKGLFRSTLWIGVRFVDPTPEERWYLQVTLHKLASS